MSRRTRKFLLRNASESAIAIDIYAILRPQSWCVYLVNTFAGRKLYSSSEYTIQLPHVPDTIPYRAMRNVTGGGAVETHRM
jgi:hypothetical protein